MVTRTISHDGGKLVELCNPDGLSTREIISFLLEHDPEGKATFTIHTGHCVPVDPTTLLPKNESEVYIRKLSAISTGVTGPAQALRYYPRFPVGSIYVHSGKPEFHMYLNRDAKGELARFAEEEIG